jgi:hypothetical protein
MLSTVSPHKLLGGSVLGAPTQKPEIVGAYKEFARLVRDITGDVTRRQAEIHSGVSHDTIARMWRGERVSEAMILRFATGYRVDANPLLEAAGYSPLTRYAGDSLPTNVVEPARQPDPEPPTQKIERVPVFPTPEGYSDLDDPIVRAAQAGAMESAEQAYRTTFKSIADALRYARKIAPGTVMGPAPDDEE